ncbi:MAG: iscU [Chthonomonadaceae bacterium]|nr:iscU [Chthonomonadaceae bacterium]
MFSAIATEHIAVPRNVGPLEGATHQGIAGVPGEGPHMILWFEVENGCIRRAAYATYGCPAAVASGSITAALLTGRTVEQALLLTAEDIIRVLQGLPEGKEECAHLAATALQNAFGEEKNR